MKGRAEVIASEGSADTRSTLLEEYGSGKENSEYYLYVGQCVHNCFHGDDNSRYCRFRKLLAGEKKNADSGEETSVANGKLFISFYIGLTAGGYWGPRT